MRDTEHHNLSLSEGVQYAQLTPSDLWVQYYALGGDADEYEVEAYALGLLTADNYQYNVIAQAINEAFIDRGANHPVAYRDLDLTD
ncbi:MAG TPA: hypothetical protein VGH85_08495 [Mycobacteriales bacterium]|jgi:hypothetical protein